VLALEDDLSDEGAIHILSDADLDGFQLLRHSNLSLFHDFGRAQYRTLIILAVSLDLLHAKFT